LIAEGDAGSFAARGLLWNASDPVGAPILLEQRLNGVDTPLEVAGSRTVDRSTGLISFKTHLGGTAYLDPDMGTVRFAGTIPSRNAVILLSYTPAILRVSTSGGAAYTGPSGLFDPRLIGDYAYWANRVNLGGRARRLDGEYRPVYLHLQQSRRRRRFGGEALHAHDALWHPTPNRDPYPV
jgi:hypothetical protein